ncbi:Transposable element Tc1 transposase-like Protein [Tribolium castaneum]|uniref:Transposable element Tc1 transposase-like Protein n=1 Tax=Tribolium castaneum TaxID=7070 RepID=D6WTP7_TRICA|nr:Transposable element Tc1 transposase-like Protein [Tribolium castaneum]
MTVVARGWKRTTSACESSKQKISTFSTSYASVPEKNLDDGRLRVINHHKKKFLRETANNEGERFVFIDDNARPHRARILNTRIEHHGITRMEWEPCSPYMNCIEHVWAEMSRSLNQLQQPPETLQELANGLQEIWRAIPQDFINNLIMSLSNRVRTLLKARGGTTRY